MPYGPKPRPEIDRFNEKLSKASSGCIDWTASTDSKGYGKFFVGSGRNKRLVPAHKWAYERYVGPVADGMHLDHLCRNRKCVNTDHLEPVSQRENILRGVGPSAVNAQKTHCPAGHEYDAANTYITRSGSRLCRACRREHDRRRKSSKAAYMRRWRLANLDHARELSRDGNRRHRAKKKVEAS